MTARLLQVGRALAVSVFLVIEPVTTSPTAAVESVSTSTLISRVVFIPGLFGSEIRKCVCGTDECKLVWGGAIEDRDLPRDSHACYKFKLFYELQKLGTTIPIYSVAANLFEEKFSSLYSELAFDWRRPIKDLDNSLRDHFCFYAQPHTHTRYYVIAHSMGGLVLKHWLGTKPDGLCDNGGTFTIREVVFVGTPHFGVTDVVDGLVKGYTPIPYRWLGRRLSAIGLDEHSALLSKHALQFESTLDFLPLLSSDYCRTQAVRLQNEAEAWINEYPYPILSVSRVGSKWQDGAQWDIFRWQTWRSLKLFRYFETNGWHYPDEPFLQPLLINVENERCDANIKPLPDKAGFFDAQSDRKIGYTYLAGIGDETTIASVVFLDDSERSLQGQIQLRGDGRVVWYSAIGIGQSKWRNTKPVQGRFSSHLGLLESQEAIDTFDRWLLIDEHFRAAQPGGPSIRRRKTQLPVVRIAGRTTSERFSFGRALRRFPDLEPMPLDPRKWSENSSRAIIDSNVAALKVAGISPATYAGILVSLAGSTRSFKLAERMLTAAALFRTDGSVRTQCGRMISA